MNDYKTIMIEQINNRMESEIWGYSISKKVFELKKQKEEKSNKIWYTGSLAVAVISFVIFMSSLFYTDISEGLYRWDGSVFSYAYFENDDNLDNDVVAANVSLLINESYPMR